MANFKRKKPKNKWYSDCTISSNCRYDTNCAVGNNRGRMIFRDLKHLPKWRYRNVVDSY